MTQDDEDQALFRDAMADVARLEQDRIAPTGTRRKPTPRPRTTEDAWDDADLEAAGEAPDFIEFRRPGVQIRLFQDLQRGLLPPEAAVDLHGMRRADAAQALRRFVGQSLQRGHRVIRVVHGKGRGSSEQGPVLKNLCYRWLLAREEVLAMVTAPRWDGGTGASYVLLARQRRGDHQLP